MDEWHGVSENTTKKSGMVLAKILQKRVAWC